MGPPVRVSEHIDCPGSVSEGTYVPSAGSNSSTPATFADGLPAWFKSASGGS